MCEKFGLKRRGKTKKKDYPLWGYYKRLSSE